jgi:hypothetical protein
MSYKIQPLNIWINGQTVTVDRFTSLIVDDPMVDGIEGSCKFCYYLGVASTNDDGSETVNWVTSGNVSMTGQTYASWSKSNQEGREYVCSQIGVTLISSPGMIATEIPLKLAPVLPQ